MSRPNPIIKCVRLLSTAGTWDGIRIVPGRNYDTAGHLRRDQAVVNISAQTAVRRSQILGEAIEASLDMSVGRRQTGLWSDATTAAIATRWRRRAAG